MEELHGDISDYPGNFLEKNKYGNLKLTQPNRIFQIITEVGVDRTSRIKLSLTASTKILHRYIKVATFDNSFHYLSVVGVLNYLDKVSRTDI